MDNVRHRGRAGTRLYGQIIDRQRKVERMTVAGRYRLPLPARLRNREHQGDLLLYPQAAQALLKRANGHGSDHCAVTADAIGQEPHVVWR